jgi:hypothetical protein
MTQKYSAKGSRPQEFAGYGASIPRQERIADVTNEHHHEKVLVSSSIPRNMSAIERLGCATVAIAFGFSMTFLGSAAPTDQPKPQQHVEAFTGPLATQ